MNGDKYEHCGGQIRTSMGDKYEHCGGQIRTFGDKNEHIHEMFLTQYMAKQNKIEHSIRTDCFWGHIRT